MEGIKERKISFVPAVTFLCLEVLSFVAFSLANSFLLYGILSLLLLVIFFIVYYKQLKTYDYSAFAYFLFPLLMFGLLSALSPFAKYDLSLADTIFIPIALISFAFNGYMVANSERFSIKKTMVVIYSALSIYTLINLLVTMIQFVPFYSFLYSDSLIYYDGAPSHVTLSHMAYALMGFSLTEVSISYFSLFPTMLLTSIIALFHISFKKEKKYFLIFLCFTIIGFLTLFLAPSRETLISDALIVLMIVLIGLISKKVIKGKIIKISLIVLSSIFGVLIVLLFLNSQPWPFIQPFRQTIKQNYFLNRLFNQNLYVSKYIPILSDLFSKIKFFGFPSGAELFIYLDGVDQIAYLSGSWFIDNFMTSGIMGAIFFLIAGGVVIFYISRYVKIKQESILDKSLLLTFVTIYFLYSLFGNDSLPYIFYDDSMPIYTQGLFLICMFLFGYMFNKVNLYNKKEVLDNENIKV